MFAGWEVIKLRDTALIKFLFHDRHLVYLLFYHTLTFQILKLMLIPNDKMTKHTKKFQVIITFKGKKSPAYLDLFRKLRFLFFCVFYFPLPDLITTRPPRLRPHLIRTCLTTRSRLWDSSNFQWKLLHTDRRNLEDVWPPKTVSKLYWQLIQEFLKEPRAFKALQAWLTSVKVCAQDEKWGGF